LAASESLSTGCDVDVIRQFVCEIEWESESGPEP
jgi:hypothetical protein